MKVAIHQPHYMPWLGYFDKMAKADLFVILDDVQMNERSPIRRNMFIDANGKDFQLAVSTEKDNEKPIKNIKINYHNKWHEKHKGFLFANYKKHKYFDEIWETIAILLDGKIDFILDLDMQIIFKIRDMLNINIPIVYQSGLNYNREAQKTDLNLSLCLAVGADVYLSGQGAKKYMITEEFVKKGVAVEFQDFTYPVYPQKNSLEFIPNLSSLDLLFNCGIDGAREIFKSNLSGSRD